MFNTWLYKVTALAFVMSTCWTTPASAAGPTHWTGYLIDQMCSEAHKSEKEPLTFIKHHPRDCALMDHCRAAGYVLYADGKWLKLDKGGSKLAEQTIRASKKSSGFYVTVDGDLSGDTIKATQIKEQAEGGQ